MMIAAKSSTTSTDVTKKEEEEEMGSEGVNRNMKMIKYCADCKTTKTPLWRGGPSGPKSLCNACGIRYRKKRISTIPMKLNKKRERSSPTATAAAAAAITTTTAANSDDRVGGCGNKELGESLKMSLVILGKDLLFQNSTVKKQRCQRRRKMGEEELAAVSLMALSCGTVFA